jgi:purine nucleoside permease
LALRLLRHPHRRAGEEAALRLSHRGIPAEYRAGGPRLSLVAAGGLEDSAAAKAYRAGFTTAPANQPPAVTRCDTVSGDTWYAGETLGRRAEDWSALLTDGKARYCTSQQEDNATLEVLRRGQAAGKVDFAHSDPALGVGRGPSASGPEQQRCAGQLCHQGGFEPSTANLLLTTQPVIRDITAQLEALEKGCRRAELALV